jgi:hypothetical protein
MTTPIILEDFLIDEPEPERRPPGTPIILEDFLIPEPEQEKPFSAAAPTAENIPPPLTRR